MSFLAQLLIFINIYRYIWLHNFSILNAWHAHLQKLWMEIKIISYIESNIMLIFWWLKTRSFAHLIKLFKYALWDHFTSWYLTIVPHVHKNSIKHCTSSILKVHTYIYIHISLQGNISPVLATQLFLLFIIKSIIKTKLSDQYVCEGISDLSTHEQSQPTFCQHWDL